MRADLLRYVLVVAAAAASLGMGGRTEPVEPAEPPSREVLDFLVDFRTEPSASIGNGEAGWIDPLALQVVFGEQDEAARSTK